MDAAAWKAKGNEQFTSKDFPAAVESFTKAIELDGTNHVLYSNRSGAFASMQQYDKAQADAEKCIEINAAWPKGYVRLGAALHGAGDLDKAIESYERGLKVDPSNASLKENLEAAQRDQSAQSNPFAKLFGPDTLAKVAANPQLQPYLAQPDYVQMINACVQNPAMSQAYMKDQRMMMTFLALSGIDMNAMRGASGVGEEKEEDDVRLPTRPMEQNAPTPAPVKKPAAKKDVKPAGDAKAAELKQEGNKFYLAREFDAALEKYKAAFEIEPKNTTFLLNMTAVYFEQGNYDLCTEECNKAIEHARENHADFSVIGKLMTRIGSCMEKAGDFDGAIAQYKKALLEWRNPETLKKKEACEKAKEKAAEEAYYNPELAMKAKEEGNAHFKKDEYPDAVKCYDEAIRRNPNDHVLYSNRAAALNKLRAYEDAIKDCDKCLSIEPNFAKAHARKGAAYFWTKQYNKALQSYDDGLKCDAEHPECLDGRRRTMMKIQENASGEGDEEAAQRAMQDPEIQNIMQDSYMQMVLGEMQKNPARINEYMQDPGISSKINKLIAAGIIRVGQQPGQQTGGRRPGM